MANFQDATAWAAMPVGGRTEFMQAEGFVAMGALLCLLTELKEDDEVYPERRP